MTTEELLQKAQEAGYEIVTDPNILVRKEAARMLPPDAPAVGVDSARGVLQAVTNQLLSPAELQLLERQSGMSVFLQVASPEVYESIKARANVREDATGAPLNIGPVLQEAVKLNATDVHISAGEYPTLRVDGGLKQLPGFRPLATQDLNDAARWVTGEEFDFETFSGDYDCAMSYANSRWRVNLYKQRHSLAMALRRIPSVVPKMETLGLPAGIRQLAQLTQGLVLFSGATGSGKSTSMAALVDRINRGRDCHIMTIEDPIEYVHSSKTALVHQREVGEDTDSFATGLRSVLRQDPDVILVGELRDLETMKMAMSAAETGHLVFATVHSTTVEEAFTRIINSFPEGQQPQIQTQMSLVVKAVVAQHLLPANGGGRVLSTEVFLGTTSTLSAIREGKYHQIGSLLDQKHSEGMHSFDYSLAELFVHNKISLEIAESYCRDVKNLNSHIETVRRNQKSMGLSSLDQYDY